MVPTEMTAYPELETRFGRLGVVERATGAPLGTAAFERHLRERYLG